MNPAKLLLPLLMLFGQITAAVEMPPANPWLASSSNSMAHGTPAQQDSVPQPGPVGPSRELRQDELQYVHTGPGFFGIQTSGVYADGKRVFWGNGLDRVTKLNYDTHEIIDEYFFPGARRYSAAEADESIAGFDASNQGIGALYRAFSEAQKLRDLANLYTLLDKDHIYYVGSKTGTITAYGEADPADSNSRIVVLREFQLPAQVTGPMVGLNMTYDGWLIAATEHGYLVAVKRDFSDYRLVRLEHSEGAAEKATRPTGYGWIRNAFAIDSAGGIYIASQQHMHKVVWTGDQLSTAESAGAWTAPYRNSWGHGTGSTPSLMGFGDEDQFVVITDGEAQMNMVLFWRNAIPDHWRQLPDTPSRRIAGQLPVTMGNPDLTEIQSEQSVVVAGYGAMVVNNQPRNAPWYLPQQAQTLLISLLGSNPLYQPYGVQKFVWNPALQQLDYAWVNKEVSSPSTVPIASVGANAAYLIGARANRWTLETIDWNTGASMFHYIIGGQRYNVMFAGTLVDEDGRIHYGTPWGRVRLNPQPR